MKSEELAQIRATEAEAVAEAYEVQVRGREWKLSECPCFEHYKAVMVAKGELAKAKRHAYAAISAITPTPPRKKRPLFLAKGVPYGTDRSDGFTAGEPGHK